MVLDSNIFIYSVLPQHAVLRDLIRANEPSASIVSRVEVLGFHRLHDSERISLEDLFTICEILPLTKVIADRAIVLRQTRKMGLGDALIAATALIHSKLLVTVNAKDFQWIEGLKLLNPLAP